MTLLFQPLNQSERSMIMRTTAALLILVAIAASQPAEILRVLCLALVALLKTLGL
jgi:hypothetical protein